MYIKVVKPGIICKIPPVQGSIIKEVFVSREVDNYDGAILFAEDKGALAKDGAVNCRPQCGLYIFPPGGSSDISAVMGMRQQVHAGGKEGDVN